MPNPNSINTQLYNAVANIAQKQDNLMHRKEQLDQANYRYSEAVEALNTAQLEFEELVNEVKKNPAADTIWHRDSRIKTVTETVCNKNNDCRLNPSTCLHNMKFSETKPEDPVNQVLRGPQNQKLVNPPIPTNPQPVDPENDSLKGGY